jgi:hypothetical protein
VSPVKYEMGFYIPENGILHSHCREKTLALNQKFSSDEQVMEYITNVVRNLRYENCILFVTVLVSPLHSA